MESMMMTLLESVLANFKRSCKESIALFWDKQVN